MNQGQNRRMLLLSFLGIHLLKSCVNLTNYASIQIYVTGGERNLLLRKYQIMNSQCFDDFLVPGDLRMKDNIVSSRPL